MEDIVPLRIAIFILVVTLIEQACYKDMPPLIKHLISIQYCMAIVMFVIALLFALI